MMGLDAVYAEPDIPCPQINNAKQRGSSHYYFFGLVSVEIFTAPGGSVS